MDKFPEDMTQLLPLGDPVGLIISAVIGTLFVFGVIDVAVSLIRLLREKTQVDTARSALKHALVDENDPDVISEIKAALHTL